MRNFYNRTYFSPFRNLIENKWLHVLQTGSNCSVYCSSWTKLEVWTHCPDGDWRRWEEEGAHKLDVQTQGGQKPIHDPIPVSLTSHSDPVRLSCTCFKKKKNRKGSFELVYMFLKIQTTSFHSTEFKGKGVWSFYSQGTLWSTSVS